MYSVHLALDKEIDLHTAGHLFLHLAKDILVGLQGTNPSNLTFLSLK